MLLIDGALIGAETLPKLPQEERAERKQRGRAPGRFAVTLHFGLKGRTDMLGWSLNGYNAGSYVMVQSSNDTRPFCSDLAFWVGPNT